MLYFFDISRQLWIFLLSPILQTYATHRSFLSTFCGRSVSEYILNTVHQYGSPHHDQPFGRGSCVIIYTMTFIPHSFIILCCPSGHRILTMVAKRWVIWGSIVCLRNDTITNSWQKTKGYSSIRWYEYCHFHPHFFSGKPRGGMCPKSTNRLGLFSNFRGVLDQLYLHSEM